MGLEASTIEAGTKAAEALTQPQRFASVIAIAALSFIGLLFYRMEARADAQIEVMQRMAAAIHSNGMETHELRQAFNAAGIRVKAVNASARSEQE